MALLRVIHAASLPDPGELARRFAGESGSPPVAQVQASASTAPAASPSMASDIRPSENGEWPADFGAVLGLLDTAREMGLAEKLRLAARLVRFAPPDIVLSSAKPFPADIPGELADVLRRLTGKSWRITTEDTPGAPSVREAQAAARAAELDWVRGTPIVKAAMEAFPAAEVVEWALKQQSVT